MLKHQEDCGREETLPHNPLESGMGILERLNRTFKYESVFRDEIETSDQLRGHLPEFERWYNEERLHSSIGYQPPIQALLQEVMALT